MAENFYTESHGAQKQQQQKHTKVTKKSLETCINLIYVKKNHLPKFLLQRINKKASGKFSPI